MSWKTTLTIIVRNLINDTGATQTYTDAKIQQAIVVAGLISAQEYSYSNSYTFDIDNIEITPDPTNSSTLDSVAMALFSLKAACLFNINSYQSAASAGIRVKDGDSEVDTTSGYGGWKSIIQNGPCLSYKQLLEERRYKRSMLSGKAIMSPFSHVDFSLSSSYTSTEMFFNSLVLR